MKLIVLYGPENSGKTTTLKMVYEVLKGLNTEEQQRFLYLDRNGYLDFRDVLKLEESASSQLKLKEESIPTQSSGENAEPSFPQDEEPKIFDENDDLDKIYPDDDPLDDDSDDELDEEEESDDNVTDNSLQRHSDGKMSLSSDDFRKIGIILEGDRGCWKNHAKHRKYKKLCDNIQDLDDCDIIICACSVRHSARCAKPSNCIKWAIRHYHARHTVVRTHTRLKGKSSSFCVPIERQLANRVLRALALMW